MTLLMQISDPHFGTERPAVVAALERLVHEQRPDVLLLSGDITQRATVPQFRAARAFVDRLCVPVLLAIPGNHDLPLFNLAVRLVAPYRRYAQAFGTELEPQFENDAVLVLAVNTTRWYRHKDGEVSAAQIERTAQRLTAARPAQCRIVLLHQPVAVTCDEDQTNLLRGHEAAVRHWAAAGVDLIVGGHIHLPFVLPLHQHLTGVARPVWAVQAGTGVSHRVRPGAGNSVNILRVGRHADTGIDATTPTGAQYEPPKPPSRRCVVERWDHAPASGRFERVSVFPMEHALDR